LATAFGTPEESLLGRFLLVLHNITLVFFHSTLPTPSLVCLVGLTRIATFPGLDSPATVPPACAQKLRQRAAVFFFYWHFLGTGHCVCNPLFFSFFLVFAPYLPDPPIKMLSFKWYQVFFLVCGLCPWAHRVFFSRLGGFFTRFLTTHLFRASCQVCDFPLGAYGSHDRTFFVLRFNVSGRDSPLRRFRWCVVRVVPAHPFCGHPHRNPLEFPFRFLANKRSFAGPGGFSLA